MSRAEGNGKREKRSVLLAIVVGSGLAILAWSQAWFAYSVPLGAQSFTGEVRGDVAAPAVMALALSALAVLAALALAGVVFRHVLGTLLVLVGAVMILQAFVAVGAPTPAIAPSLTDASGLAGEQTIADAVAQGTVDVSFWPWLAVIAGVVLASAGLGTLLTARRWPRGGRRFTTTSLDHEDAPRAASQPHVPGRTTPSSGSDLRVDQWDALSHGDDPTDAGGRGASS